LVHRWLGDDAAIRHEKETAFAEAGILDFHDHATGSGGGRGCDLDDLEEGPQDAAGDLVGAGDEAVRLVHGDHHGAVVIGQEHGVACFLGLEALGAAQKLEAMDEAVKILAFGGVDDADALEGDVEAQGGFLDLGAVAEKDGHAETQRIELAGGLKHARFGTLREDDPFGMPLQFFDDLADEPHPG
jgi:hypothetical protein